MTESRIMEELKAIKKDLRYIRKHMVDADAILTPDEKRILGESLEEFEKGKTSRLEDLERETSETQDSS